MKSISEILKEAASKNIISIKQYNEGIPVFIVYRIVWETKNHHIVQVFSTEDQAKKFVENKPSDEYFYQKAKIT